MISALLIAVSMSVETVDPTPPPMPSASGEVLPNSLAMYVSLLEPVVTAGGASVQVAPISGALRIGGILSGRHALLVGISFAGAFASNTNGVTISFMPTYRYHLTPLTAGGFSPYVQVELFVGYTTSTGGGGGTNTIPFGFGGSFGAEYLVTRNFGIIAGAGLRFIHSQTAFGGTVVQSGNMIAMYVSAGLGLHF